MMRVYFYFNLQTHTFICHEMAKYWKKKHGWKDFSGLLAIKNGIHYDYLIKQSDINYLNLDVIDFMEKEALRYSITGEMLNEWEKKLEIPLWHLAVADRNIGHWFVKGGIIPKTDIMKIASHEVIKKFICYYLDFFNKRLSDFNPSFVFFTALASMPALALANICRWKKIPFYILKSIRIGNRWAIVSNDNKGERLYRIENEFRTLCSNNNVVPELPDEFQKYYESFTTKKPEKPIWSKTVAKKVKTIRKEKSISFFSMIAYDFIRTIYYFIRTLNKKKRDLRYKDPFSNWWIKTNRKLAIRYLKNSEFKNSIEESEPYVLFPLHLNPEASTMVLAPNFVNQLSIIDVLSKNIPLNYKLYIKEHPSMVGLRPKRFYKQIKQYPNVRLISPYADNFAMIRNAGLVVVITGTAGWEAVLMGRPVLTLGECFYTGFNLTKNCTDFSKLGQIIRETLFSNIEIKQENIKRLLYLLSKHSFSIPNILWNRTIDIEGLNDEEKRASHRICEEVIKMHNVSESEKGAIINEIEV